MSDGEDGLVGSMFRGNTKDEKETVVVVIDRSSGGETAEGGHEAGAEGEVEEIDLENVNVVFVYRDGASAGEWGGQVIERAHFATPEGADLRFSGAWVRRVHSDVYSLEVRMDLWSDGSFAADVDGERVDSGEIERARLSGEWDARGDDVVVQVHETSNPRLFPKGMLEVFGSGRVGGGVWTFLDTRGVRRTARRPRIENTPPEGGGGVSGDA